MNEIDNQIRKLTNEIDNSMKENLKSINSQFKRISCPTNYKESCYFFKRIRDMGGTIPTCMYFDKLGYCPCDVCDKYIDSKNVFDIVKKHVDLREKDEQMETIQSKPTGK